MNKRKTKTQSNNTPDNIKDDDDDDDDDEGEVPIIRKKKRSRKTPTPRETLGEEEWLRFKNFKQQMSKYICTTRFTNSTWEENQNYVNANKHKCIYGSPFVLCQRIPPDAIVFVLEMNNDKNRIMGIGLIRNHPIYRKHRIYENGKYNRYAYMGMYHIARQDMSPEEEQIMRAFDILCFKGSKHMKRGSGINLFSDEILFRCLRIIDLVEFVSLMFKRRMNKTRQTNKNKEDKKDQ